MKKTTKIQIAGGVLLLSAGYLIVRSIQRKKLFNEIAEQIGPASNLSLSSFQDYLNPAYAESPTGYSVSMGPYIRQGDTNLNRWANSLYEFAGTFDDDEGQVYGILNALPDAVAVSDVAGKFQRRHNTDLLEYLNKYMDTKGEQSKMAAIISKKPPFRLSA